MANPEKRKLFGVIKNLSSVVSEALHSKTISMIILLAIIAAVPLTVIVAQKQQEIRQQAAGLNQNKIFNINTTEVRVQSTPVCRCWNYGGLTGYRWKDITDGGCESLGYNQGEDGDRCSWAPFTGPADCICNDENKIDDSSSWQCRKDKGSFCNESIAPDPPDTCEEDNGDDKQNGTACEEERDGESKAGKCNSGVCYIDAECVPGEVQKFCGESTKCQTKECAERGSGLDRTFYCRNNSASSITICDDFTEDERYFVNKYCNGIGACDLYYCMVADSEGEGYKNEGNECDVGKTCQNGACINESSVSCSSGERRQVCLNRCNKNDNGTGNCSSGESAAKMERCKDDGSGWEEVTNSRFCTPKSSADSPCAGFSGGCSSGQRPECTDDSGCSSDKRCDEGRCVPRGTGGVGSCTGQIVSNTCENGRPKTLKVKYNVSAKPGQPNNSCNVYIGGASGTVEVNRRSNGDAEDNLCTTSEVTKDVPITNTGNHTLFVSSGGSEGDLCYNEEKDPPFNVTCDAAPRDPEPTTGNPDNRDKTPGTGAGQGIACGDNPSSLRPGELPPGGYKWVANCGGPTCSSNRDCPPNNFDVRNVNPETSNWCYGFTPQWKCMKLVKQGCENGTEASCTGSCTAESLQPRFRVEGVLGGNWFPDPRLEGTPRVEANTDVNLAVFKNNQQTFAGAGVRARITGPGIDRDVKTDRVDSFKPTQSGTYTLSVACGTARHNTSVTLQVGAAGSICRTAQSLQPRFQKNISAPWEETLTNITIGEPVRVAVFKNGDTNYAGAGTTAKITGPNNFKRENVSTTAIETFVPTAGGDYILESTCGPITQKATLKVDAIQECKPEKVDMSAKSVKTLSSTDIFVNEDIKFVIMGEQGQTQKRDEWAPAGIVSCTGGFFGSKTCQASSSGTLTWKHFWKNCAAGSETNCRTEECVKPLNVTVKAIPNFAVSGNIASDSGRLIGMPGLTVKIKNDETNATASATTDNNGNFAFQSLPRGSRYTLTVEAYPRFGGKEYYSSSNYPVHFALLEDKTSDSKKIKIVFKEKTASTKIPIGRITAGNCDTPVIGYACIPGDEAKLNIEIRDFNGNRILRETADDDGGDEQCQTPMHGFKFDIPVELRDGAEHSVALRAINPGAGPNAEFEGSPFTFTCSNPADLDNDDDVDAMDYNIIWNRYHDQTPLVECSGTNRAPICRYANAQGKIDLRGFAKWMVDAYSFLK